MPSRASTIASWACIGLYTSQPCWQSPKPDRSTSGVSCSSIGRVVVVDLTNATLLGSLQLSHLLALQNLQHVNFHCNYFSEGDLSWSYRGTCKLESLDLSFNNLTLPLLRPSLLRGCLHLASLILSHNFISPSLPLCSTLVSLATRFLPRPFSTPLSSTVIISINSISLIISSLPNSPPPPCPIVTTSPLWICLSISCIE